LITVNGTLKKKQYIKNLNNNIITSLSVLTPSLILHESVRGAFNTLAKALPNAVKSEELGQLDEEVRAYQIDTDLGALAKCFEENIARIDVDWWSKIFAMKMPGGGLRFPILREVGKGSSVIVHWPSCRRIV